MSTQRIPNDLKYMVTACQNTDNNIVNKLISNQMSQSELFYKYKSSVRSGLWHFTKHLIVMYYMLHFLWVFKNSYIAYCIIPIFGLFLGKTFIIFHDCQHNSYTPNKDLNYVLSHIMGIFVTASPNWIIDHSTHHSTNGNIENIYNYVFNETVVFTVNQYNKFSHWRKTLYKIYKTPIVFFGIIPVVYFGIFQRFLYIIKKMSYPEKIGHSLSTIVINHTINNAGICVLLYYLHTYGILYHYLMAWCISYSTSFIVFHNQHTYNPPFVVGNEKWNMLDSGLKGSSFIQLPWFLKYFFGGIEYHHIHHMNAKIPGYNLHKYHDDVVNTSNLFDNVVKLSLMDCYNNLWLILYCERRNKYITFDELDTDDELDTK